MVRPLALIIIGSLVATSGAAVSKAAKAPHWVIFETLPEGIIFIDAASIQKQGNRADMWVLIDYKQPQDDRTGKKIKSDKLHYRYDCDGRTFTIVTSSAHAGAMGNGAVIDVNADPQVSPVPPGTTAEQMWKRACGIAG